MGDKPRPEASYEAVERAIKKALSVGSTTTRNRLFENTKKKTPKLVRNEVFNMVLDELVRKGTLIQESSGRLKRIK